MIKLKTGSVIYFKSKEKLKDLRDEDHDLPSGVHLPCGMIEDMHRYKDTPLKINSLLGYSGGKQKFTINELRLRSWTFTEEMIKTKVFIKIPSILTV